MYQIDLGHNTFNVTNIEEAKGLWDEIFKGNSYYFDTDNQAPVIVDVGAHVGLSVAYFKQLYPNSRIVALEPNPTSFQLLNENIKLNQWQQVEPLQKAVWSKTGQVIEMYQDVSEDRWLSTSGVIKGAWNFLQSSQSYKAETVYLNDLIQGKVDLLKLDVEGAEQRVLVGPSQGLAQVERLIFEYHPVRVGQNYLSKIQDHLERLGFTQVHSQHQKTSRGKLLILEYLNQRFGSGYA